MLGLSKDELEGLFSFGNTQEERSKNLLGGRDEPWWNIVDNLVNAMRAKTIELILANNERITKQLEDAGIK